MSILDSVAHVFRDFAVFGVPVSGPNEPPKSEIRGLFAQLVAVIGSGDIPTELAADIAAIAIQIESVQTNADLTQLAKTAAVAASAAAVAAQAGAETARDEALAYAELTGPFEFYATKSAANAALAGLPANQLVQVWADESQAGARTVYKKVSSAYVLQATLDYVTPSSADTLSNKTFGGTAPFILGGGRAIFASGDALPSSPSGLVHIENLNADNVGLRVQSFWEGATGADYVNNDCTLFVVHSKVASNSANKSWAASLSNAYRDIPAGVTDNGEAVGVIGWAASVAIAGYQHAGTLAAQCGVRGRAGFQGAGSAVGAVVQNAVGVDGSIVSESAGTVIENAIAVRAVVDNPTGSLVNSTAIYARAAPGSNNTRVFDGQGGVLYNVDPIECANYIQGVSFKVGSTVLADKDGTTWTRLWAIDDNVAIRLGATRIVHTRAEHVLADPDAATEFAVFDADGAVIRMDVFANNAAAVSGGKAVGTLYKTATGEVRIVV